MADKPAFDEKMEKNDFDHGFDLFYTETSSHKMRLQVYSTDLKKHKTKADFEALYDHVEGLFDTVDRKKAERLLSLQRHDSGVCTHVDEGKSLLELPETISLAELAEYLERLYPKKEDDVKEEL